MEEGGEWKGRKGREGASGREGREGLDRALIKLALLR